MIQILNPFAYIRAAAKAAALAGIMDAVEEVKAPPPPAYAERLRALPPVEVVGDVDEPERPGRRGR